LSDELKPTGDFSFFCRATQYPINRQDTDRGLDSAWAWKRKEFSRLLGNLLVSMTDPNLFMTYKMKANTQKREDLDEKGELKDTKVTKEGSLTYLLVVLKQATANKSLEISQRS